MWKIALKLMRKSVRMLIASGIAILIGSMFMSATLLFANSVDDLMVRNATNEFGSANYAISFRNPNSSPSSEIHYKDLHLDEISKMPGVNGIRSDDATALVRVEKGDKSVTSIAWSNGLYGNLPVYKSTEGRDPQEIGEITLIKSIAKSIHANIGDTITLVKVDDTGGDKEKSYDVRVVGLVDDGEHSQIPFSNRGTYLGGITNDFCAKLENIENFDNQVVQSKVYMSIDESKINDLSPKINALLPSRFSLMSRHEVGVRSVRNVSNGTNFVTMFLLSFGILALLISSLVIANTFQVLVAQRRRTLALLRVIGAQSHQLYAAVLLEAAILGVISAAVGVLCAIGFMGAISNVNINSGPLSKIPLIVSLPAIVWPIAIGTIVTVLASMSAARSATKVTPMEALRPMDLIKDKRASIIRAVFGVLFIVVGILATALSATSLASMIAGKSPNAGSDSWMTLLGAMFGCALVFIGIIITATFWMPFAMKATGAIMALCGPASKVANANVQRNPRRVAATGTALLIGVTLVSTVVTGAICGKATLKGVVDDRYSVDIIIQGKNVDESLAADISKISGIKHTELLPAVPMTFKNAKGKTEYAMAAGVDNVNQLKNVMHTDLDGVNINKDSILLPKFNEEGGEPFELKKGNLDLQAYVEKYSSGETDSDNITPFTGTNTDSSNNDKSITVKQVQFKKYRNVNIYSRNTAFVSKSYFNNYLKPTTHILLISVDSSKANLVDIVKNIRNITSSYAEVMAAGSVFERAQWESAIDVMMMLLVGLIAVAVVIALIGVANTLSLSVIERTKESATLRAIGMTRGQVRRSLALEATLISLTSTVSGLIVGTVFGWIGSYMVFSVIGKVPFVVDWAIYAVLALIALLAALLSSVLPARRAVKSSPVVALAEE
ncbi:MULTISPECIES: ABC transporter permease [Gardnerella]|uniref:Efflux ABC transporter, permease protein n=1 Tax=Gardnerella vaginalis (strain ATCC 14019 / 317) TaxID=525284 RepID=E3D9N7_GARV3|nr:FtsX-like permease family protein [Gardnerella vaginalis]ADP38781.1 efflux ABC transporter, permease protein [Gardnerella vaginalis ATCC 14019]KOS08549.1 multidrug DMT transporter permease [Gardnerella vaginalis]MDK8337930.1 FtsX-like permease family protein [Gardnerella vaginalis]PKZ57054.1 transporter [Gardnerella vaginalis]PKZ74063.1 transporter [Gardnerella vaginalis]